MTKKRSATIHSRASPDQKLEVPSRCIDQPPSTNQAAQDQPTRQLTARLLRHIPRSRLWQEPKPRQTASSIAGCCANRLPGMPRWAWFLRSTSRLGARFVPPKTASAGRSSRSRLAAARKQRAKQLFAACLRAATRGSRENWMKRLAACCSR
jgi:hypothetical protein